MTRWLRSSSGFATVGTAIAVVAASILALVGVGTDKSLFDFGSGFAWLQSNDEGQALLVNGADGKGTAKLNVPGSKGKRMRVEQRDGHAYVVVDEDGETKILYRLDDATLNTGAQRRIGKAERIVRGGDAAYLVNEETGVVQPIDPDTLEPRGERLTFKGRIDVAADDDGRLVVVELESAQASVVENGSAGEPVPVGSAGDDLRATVAGGRTAVVNVSRSEVTRFEGKKPAKIVLPAGAGELLVPEAGESDELVMLRRDGDRGELVRVNLKDGSVSKVGIDAPVRGVRPPLATPEVVFLVDPGAGQVTTVNPADGSTISTVDAEVGRGGDLEAFVKDGFLWLNNPGGRKAVVVDKRGRKKDVDKYDEKVPVLNPDTPPDQPPSDLPPPPSGPPAPTPGAATPTPSPSEAAPPPAASNAPPPVANAPGIPTNFKGVPSNKSVSLSWTKPPDSGAPIDKYALRCNPDCGNGQSTVELGAVENTIVRDLVNGTSYDFELAATNAIGTGPSASAKGLIPTGDVPGQPSNVSAQEKDDGTVTITWKADSEGLSLTGFEVVATSDSPNVGLTSPSPFSVSDPKATSFTTKPDDLGYDVDSTPDWSFTVKAKGTKAGQVVESLPSNPSSKVDVYKKPSFASGSRVTGTGSDRTAQLSWPAADHNGRAVTYAVTQCTDPCSGAYSAARLASGPSVAGRQVTAAVSGLSNGTSYDFRVVATNDAGDSPPITSTPVKAHRAPSISVTAAGSDQSNIYVNVQTDFFGDTGSCTETSPYSGPVGCAGRIGAGGLSAGTTYTFRICARNGSGDPDACASAQVRTADPTPPPPAVQVSRGAATSVSGCTSNCFRVHVKLVNIGTPATVQCSDWGGVFYTYTARAADTEVCAYGSSGNTVTVTVNGVSGSYRWP